MIPPKRFDIFPLTGGCSEDLDAFRVFFGDLLYHDIFIAVVLAGRPGSSEVTMYFHTGATVLLFLILCATTLSSVFKRKIKTCLDLLSIPQSEEMSKNVYVGS